jgi:5-methylcytosine-specific restriction endonuclease McrA
VPIDKSKYPSDWEAISSRIRFNRAKNMCEKCGAENYKPHPVTGADVVLSVAHLNRDTTDNRDENLKALCQFCHLAHDRGDNAMRRRYGKNYTKHPKLPFYE